MRRTGATVVAVLLGFMVVGCSGGAPGGSARPSVAPVSGVALQPTQVTPVDAWRDLWLGKTSSVSADSDQGTWALGSGRLVRVAADGSVQDWTLVDDAAFDTATGVAAGRDGGVWIFDQRALRHFDGTRFTAVVRAPDAVSGSEWMADAAQGPDGQLWVSMGGGVHRWDGTAWSAVRWPFDAFAGEIGFDAHGQTVVGGVYFDGAPFAAVFDGRAWTALGGGAPAQDGELHQIATAPDGVIWFASGGGLLSHDGTRWSVQTPFGTPDAPVSSVTVAADGTVWVAGSSPTSGGSAIARNSGAGWEPVEVPHRAGDPVPVQALVATAAGLTAAGRAGIFRLAGEPWVKVYPTVSTDTRPGQVRALAAVSADEVFTASDLTYEQPQEGLWRYYAGTWRMDMAAANPEPLAVSPDGSVWAAGYPGPWVRNNGSWRLAIDPADLPEIADTVDVAFAPDGAVLAAAREGGVISLTGGPAWQARQVPGLPLDSATNVAVTTDGTIWAGTQPAVTGTPDGPTAPKDGLARFDGTRWTVEYPLGQAPPDGHSLMIADLLAASDGSLWVAGQQSEVTNEDPAQPSGDPIRRHFIARHADGHWAVSDEFTWPGPDDFERTGRPFVLVEQADGTILSLVNRELRAHRGAAWTPVLHGQIDFIAGAPDGSIWLFGNDVYRLG